MSSEFIYLRNDICWFGMNQLKPSDKDNKFPYDIDSFQNEVIKQISVRDKTLDQIKVKFSERYPEKLFDHEITFHLTEHKFQHIASLIPDEKLHPILAFHGSSPSCINNIIDNGYDMPGTGHVKRHGNFGCGIYTSPFFDKANNYSIQDTGKNIYLIVNLVLPGKHRMISDISTHYPDPVNGVHGDGSNTHIIYGISEIISADSNRVVPIATIKISSK
jgi:hypothetical protein